MEQGLIVLIYVSSMFQIAGVNKGFGKHSSIKISCFLIIQKIYKYTIGFAHSTYKVYKIGKSDSDLDIDGEVVLSAGHCSACKCSLGQGTSLHCIAFNCTQLCWVAPYHLHYKIPLHICK